MLTVMDANDETEGSLPSSKLTEQLVSRGMDALLQGQFSSSTWALDCALYLAPDKASTLWQRGLACFYSSRFEDGAHQFETDMTENGSDVEEVIWHFLCCCKLHGFQKAQKNGFLPLSVADPCVPPMLEVLNLFQGKGSVEDVFMAAQNPDGSPVQSYNNTNGLAYAHFYVGPYHEIQGDVTKAKKHLKTAAEMKNPDYVGRLMGMHYKLFCRTVVQQKAMPVFSLGKEKEEFPQIIQGGWQLSEGHLKMEPDSKANTIAMLLQAYDAGIRAFDCGDIYTGVEELYGNLISAHCKRGGNMEDIILCAKIVPDLDHIRARKVNNTYIRSVVRRSLNRFGVKRINLVQFFWWDYFVPGYIEAMMALKDLSIEGTVKQIGIGNFDVEHTREIIDAGIPIVSTQVQFSLLDQRPLKSGLVSLCKENNIKILAYGVLAGGFLTGKWLGAALPSVEALENRSLVKYLLIIEEFGGWKLFQELLQTLSNIASRCSSLETPESAGIEEVSVAMVAIQYVLSQEQVGGVIVGAHDPKYLQSTISATKLQLSNRDLAEIESVLAKAKGLSGPVYWLERVSDGSHGKIMKYNLNQINQGAHLEELCHRFLKLQFEAYPAEATRTGYRHPPSPSYEAFCKGFCSGRLDKVHDPQQYALFAARACNYDHYVTIAKEQNVVNFCQNVQSLLQEAEGIDKSTLTSEQLVDYEIIMSQLKLELIKWQKLQMHKRNPGFYLPLNAILYLLPVWGPESIGSETKILHLQDRSHPGVAEMSISERLIALLFRLRAIPGLMQVAQENMSDPFEIFLNTTMEISSSFQLFLDKDVPRLCTDLISMDSTEKSSSSYDSILSEIAFASKVASACVEKYGAFLRQILPTASSASSIGKDVYESILKYSYFIDSSDELLLLGEKHFDKVKQELKAIANEIDPSQTWQEITENIIRPKHPQANDLLSAYMTEIERSRQHMISNDLIVPLPSGERVLGFYTPRFLEPFSPFGDFLNPSPFAGMGSVKGESRGNRVTGHLMLHSIKAKQLPKDEEERLLRAHDYTWITVIAPHETYPGHHVQALLAQQHPRVLRKYFESILFYEGWGLYIEQLAYETRFFEKELVYSTGTSGTSIVQAPEYAKLARITQLRLQLWRAARVILDVKINTGELSFRECQEFLKKEVMFNHTASKGEVFMYVSRPGYTSCYIAGFIMLMKLREQMKRKCAQTGKVFSLKEFHRSVLSKGCIPFQLLETLL